MSNNLGNLWFVVQEFKGPRVSNYTSHLKDVWGWGSSWAEWGDTDICTTNATMTRHHHDMKCAHCWLAYSVTRCKFLNVVNVGIWACI